jgi:excisionase family DNA binding protein
MSTVLTASVPELRALDVLIRDMPAEHKPALLTALAARVTAIASSMVVAVGVGAHLANEQMLTVGAVAGILGLSNQSVYQMVASGALPAMKTGTKRRGGVRIRESAVRALIAQREAHQG